jgi:hypothetical protein
MANNDKPKEIAEANMAKSGTKCEHVTAIIAGIIFPPINGHGWENGLWETANNRIAEAPIDATITGSAEPLTNRLLTYPTRKIATNAANAERNFSAVLNGAVSGTICCKMLTRELFIYKIITRESC